MVGATYSGYNGFVAEFSFTLSASPDIPASSADAASAELRRLGRSRCSARAHPESDDDYGYEISFMPHKALQKRADRQRRLHDVLALIIVPAITVTTGFSHFAFQNLQSVQTVDQIQQTVVGAENIVTLDRLLSAAGAGT